MMREMKRWTAWMLLAPRGGGKPPKKPLSLTNDAATWRAFDVALREAEGRAGIGFQMLGVSSLAGIDLDGCVDPTTGAMSAFAASLLAACPATYAEITPSGKGLRIFALIPPGVKVPEFLSRQHGAECYIGRSARFLTLTGHALEGRAGKLAELTPNALRLLMPLAASAGGGTELEIKLPVPMTERREAWQELFDSRLPYGKLRKEWRDFLEAGDLPGGRSEKSFGIAAKLVECRYLPDDIFAILISAPGSWEAALDKRDQDVTRARALIWADIGRAQKVIRADETGLQERVDTWAGLGLRTIIEGKKVQVEWSQMNTLRILTEHDEWRGRLALDVTSGGLLLDGTALDDARFFEMQEKVSAFAGWRPSGNRKWWEDVVRTAASKNPMNPREKELRSLVWDGKPRLDTWLTDFVADEDNKLNRLLGRKWLISCVARWVNPGCKNDTVLILQGVEGARKNTLLETIAGGTTRVKSLNGIEKDDKFTVAQAWIVQLPEGHLLRKADRLRFTAFVSEPNDDFRPPYAALPGCFKRGWVLVSTSNHHELFNTDQNGLRRYWPVWCRERIAYEEVAKLRDQLLAEAVVAYDLEEPWWFDSTPEELRERVAMSVESTALDEAICALIPKQAGKGGLTINELLSELGATLGYRPQDRAVTALLFKHGIIHRRTTTHRFWLHPSWARADRPGEADIIPLRRVRAVDDADEVLS